MALAQSFLDELRARTSLSGLVGRAVSLKKAGGEWRGCCPFHNEKTPSFYVNDDKAFYHCFGCSAHGDAISWLVDHEGLEFLDAVRQLADANGMDMPARDAGAVERDREQAGQHEILGRAEAWFRQQLGGLQGRDARAYLERRGISADSMREFGIGFAPGDRARMRGELARDLSEPAMIEAGLLIRPEDGGDAYDRFRSRVMFPIHDARGRPIAFGGRILGDGQPKYLNSPDTPLFDKGRTLFNLHRAGPAGRKAGRAIAVEGYMDVIALAQLGIAEAVAPLGTALTEHQLGLLWRIAPEPILCFDGDKAGQKASARAAIRALPDLQPGRTLRFAILPAGQDPDDIARQGGLKAIEELLDRAIPLVELLWRHEHGAGSLSTPEARAALRQRLVEHARAIGDRDLAREYEQDFRRRVDDLFAQARPARRGRKAQAAPALSEAKPSPAGSIRRKSIVAVLRGLVRFPEVLASETESLARLGPRDKAIEEALELLLDSAFGFGRPAPHPHQIDELFPEERGWRGFQMSWLLPETWPELAKADLRHSIDMLLASQEGASEEELIKIVRAYKPPSRPEEPPKGLLP